MVSESVHTAVLATAAVCDLVLLSLMIFFTHWVVLLWVALAFALIASVVFVTAFIIQFVTRLRYKVAPLVTVVLLIIGMIASLIAGIVLVVRASSTGQQILQAAAMYAFLPIGAGITQLLLIFFAPPPRFANIQADAQKKLGTTPSDTNAKGSKEPVAQSSVRQSSVEEQSGDAQEGSMEGGDAV